ncbi:hypothetical protein FOCC_FOCC001975 [Frankliniella occidentalis]|nr:hypothetical protein FOCC_FOCC001975 [Frankliniella occidentalis]
MYMAEKKVTSKVDVTVCIPLPQLPKREDTLTTTSHSLVSSDGLWSWTLELEALKPSDEYRKFQLKVLCSAHDQKSPSSKRIISWGGRLECMFRHSSVSKLANIGRYLDTPYEFFTKKYALPYPTEIKFEINLSAIVMQKSSEPKRAPSGVSLLTKSLGSLLESGIMSDVQLCTEGEEIPAHCSILAARSDFFKTMFKPEWNRGVGNSVNVNMSPPILKEMLSEAVPSI